MITQLIKRIYVIKTDTFMSDRLVYSVSDSARCLAMDTSLLF